MKLSYNTGKRFKMNEQQITGGGERCMAVSRNTEYRPQSSFWKRLVGQLSRYDLLLAAIPLVLALSLAVYAIFAIPFEMALAGGALISVLCIADALYFHPPTDSTET